MANRLPREKVEQMWAVYQDRQSVREVARKCAVSHVTVERYRSLERWDERLREIQDRAHIEADASLATAMADSLKLVRAYKGKLAQALAHRLVSPEEVDAAELERLIKLEAFLLGGVEARSEVVGRFAHLTDEQLEAYARDGVLPG